MTTAVPRLLLLPPLGTSTSTGCVYVRVTGWLAQTVQTDVMVVTCACGSVAQGTVIVTVTGAVHAGSVQTVVMIVMMLVTDVIEDGCCCIWDDEPEDEAEAV